MRDVAHLLLGSTSETSASGLLWGIVLFSLGTCMGRVNTAAQHLTTSHPTTRVIPLSIWAIRSVT